MINKQKSNFVICYGGCGRIGKRTIDLFIKKNFYVLNIDPNYENYADNLNPFYCGFDNTDLEGTLSKLINLIKKYKKKYNFLGIINFSRIKINTKENSLSTSNSQNNKVFQIMLFDFIKIIDKLVDLEFSDFSIINFSSLNSTQVSHQSILYHSIKGAIESSSRVLAYKLAHKNIRSNVIVPALVNDNHNDKSKVEINSIPLRRGAPSSKDISNLVLFLLSKESSYITGSCIKIDSGMSLPDSYTILSNYIDNN